MVLKLRASTALSACRLQQATPSEHRPTASPTEASAGGIARGGWQYPKGPYPAPTQDADLKHVTQSFANTSQIN